MLDPFDEPDVGDYGQPNDTDPNHYPDDEMIEFAYEGEGDTDVGTLSSIISDSSADDQSVVDFEYLKELGPEFSKLADLYSRDKRDNDGDNNDDDNDI